jgi:tRNA dimethylallyltransferase
VKVIIVSGATATGKTDISIELARKFGGEIVNFDSLLLYQEITIGTAKPTPSEQGEIPHHMLDVASVSRPLNASDYAKEALKIIHSLEEKKTLVYLVGGSGFYLQALIKGMYDSPTTPLEIQKRSDELYQNEGITPFLEFLELHDVASFKRYHENDHYRVRRAVEHFWANGSPLSEKRSQKDQENQELPLSNIHGWELLNLYLDIPKDLHLRIIERRTDRMLSHGLLEEAQGLLKQGFTGDEKPLKSIGYKEVFDYLKGEFKSLEECRERIIISTRQLAKSQRTWFNRDASRLCFNPLTEKEQIFQTVENFITGRS